MKLNTKLIPSFLVVGFKVIQGRIIDFFIEIHNLLLRIPFPIHLLQPLNPVNNYLYPVIFISHQNYPSIQLSCSDELCRLTVL
jgi:hypothetical protein